MKFLTRLFIACLMGCQSDRPQWSDAPYGTDTTDVETQWPSMLVSVDGARPLGVQLGVGPEGTLRVAWAQRSGLSNAAGWRHVAHEWSETGWHQTASRTAPEAWYGLGSEGVLWSLIPAAADQPATLLSDTRHISLPPATRLGKMGQLVNRSLRAPTVTGHPLGGPLVARRLGLELAVMRATESGLHVLGDALSVDRDGSRSVGAPAITADKTGRVLAVWQVVLSGTPAEPSSPTAGLAVRLFDGTRWSVLSSPQDPDFTWSWPVGPVDVSQRTRRDRQRQAAWKKRFGRRNTEVWPSPVAAALTAEGPVAAWRGGDGWFAAVHNGSSWQPIVLPDPKVEELALGVTPTGQLRIASTSSGRLTVTDLSTDTRISRPGLPLTGASSPTLQDNILAWRQEILGGYAVSVARWDNTWTTPAGTSVPQDVAAKPNPQTATLVRDQTGPLVVDTEDGHIRAWWLTDQQWLTGPTLKARGAGDLRATSTEGDTIVVWQDKRRARGAIHAAVLNRERGEWTRLRGPGPNGALLTAPDRANEVLAVAAVDGEPRVLLKVGDKIVRVTHIDGVWKEQVPVLEVPTNTRAIAAAFSETGRAAVALWTQQNSKAALQLFHTAGTAWSLIETQPYCSPVQGILDTLSVAISDNGHTAVAWQSLMHGSRAVLPPEVCLVGKTSTHRLPPPSTPVSTRVPQSRDDTSIGVSWSDDTLFVASRGVAPRGATTLVSRWDETDWRPALQSSDGIPDGGGSLVSTSQGVCLLWTHEATDGGEVEVTCLDRSPD